MPTLLSLDDVTSSLEFPPIVYPDDIGFETAVSEVDPQSGATSLVRAVVLTSKTLSCSIGRKATVYVHLYRHLQIPLATRTMTLHGKYVEKRLVPDNFIRFGALDISRMTNREVLDATVELGRAHLDELDKDLSSLPSVSFKPLDGESDSVVPAPTAPTQQVASKPEPVPASKEASDQYVVTRVEEGVFMGSGMRPYEDRDGKVHTSSNPSFAVMLDGDRKVFGEDLLRGIREMDVTPGDTVRLTCSRLRVRTHGGSRIANHWDVEVLVRNRKYRPVGQREGLSESVS